MEHPPLHIELLAEADAFVRNLPQKAKEKVTYNMLKVSRGVKDPELFKKIEGSNIWEFRTQFNGQAYRLFAFWDTQRSALIVATHGLQKKAQKTPAKEIAKAERIRQAYFEAQ